MRNRIATTVLTGNIENSGTVSVFSCRYLRCPDAAFSCSRFLKIQVEIIIPYFTSSPSVNAIGAVKAAEIKGVLPREFDGFGPDKARAVHPLQLYLLPDRKHRDEEAQTCQKLSHTPVDAGFQELHTALKNIRHVGLKYIMYRSSHPEIQDKFRIYHRIFTVAIIIYTIL